MVCLQKIVVTGSMSELLAQDLAMWNELQAMDSALQVPAPPSMPQTQTGFCSPAAINAAAGAAGAAVAGGAALAELGLVGVAAGGAAGGVIGGIAGYYSTNTLPSEALVGTVVGTGSSGMTTNAGAIGGAIGGAVTYGAQQLGTPDVISVPAGGALGGAVGSALAFSLDGVVGKGVAASAEEGGAIGFAAAAISVAVAAGLHARCGS